MREVKVQWYFPVYMVIMHIFHVLLDYKLLSMYGQRARHCHWEYSVPLLEVHEGDWLG